MNMQEVMSSTLTWWVIALAVGYTVGRVGIPTLYQDIKHFIQGVRSSVSVTKAPVTTTAGQ
jgi:hypothetical protein